MQELSSVMSTHVKPMGKHNKVVDVISARAPRRRRRIAHVCRRGDVVPGKFTVIASVNIEPTHHRRPSRAARYLQAVWAHFL